MRLRPLLLLVLCVVCPLAEPHAQQDVKALADDDARLTTVEARQQALSTLLTAAQQSLNAGLELEAARAWNRAGRLQIQLNLPEEAITTYLNALKVLAHSPDPATQTDSLNGLAKAHTDLGQCDKAEPLLRKAITLSQQHNKIAGKAEALLIMSACQDFRDHSLSLQTAAESLELWRSLGDQRGMARAYSALGDYHMAQNNLMDSTQSFQMALELWRELKMPQGEAEALIGLGFLEYRKGAWQASLSFYTQAEQLFDENAEPFMMGQITAGLAEAFIESGLPETGLDKYRESLDYYRRTKNPRAEIGIEWGIGRTHYILGNYLEALAILDAARTKAKSMGDPTIAAHCDDFLGRTYHAMDDYAAALNHFQAALEGFTKTRNPMEAARTRALMGQIYERQGNLRKAKDRYQTALESFRALSDQVNESATLYALGSLELKEGDLDAAERHLQQSIQVTEKMRRVSTSVDLTAAFSARVHDRYEKYIDCLMRKHSASPSRGLAVHAFETSELARARSLTELLRATQTNLFPGLDPQLALQEKQVRQSLQINENARVTLLSRQYRKEELTVLEEEHKRLETEYQTVIEAIRVRSPVYQDIIHPRAWTLEQIQKQVVADDQTVLLEFSLGSEKSYLWVVTRFSINSYELPSQAEILKASERVYKLIALAPNTSSSGELAPAVQDLSRMILSSVGEPLNRRRVIVVADGALNYIPFQVLTATKDEPLVAHHEIINAPSASILGELQQEAARRPPARNVLAAFGDPAFAPSHSQRNDPNDAEQLATLRTETARWRSALRDIELNGDSFDPSVVQPLFYAKRELANLREVAGADALVAGQFAATRELLLGTDLTQYAMLHLATHGYLNPKRPENSGFVLSTVDREGRELYGFVGLRTIYELRAPVALVVLSACQTGLGKDVRGEGLVGLTRGFMYAGASSVVASLWKVDDEATAELMRHFYSNLLQKGMSPADALREAQNSIRQRPEWSAPYFWAAFTLQGDYRQPIEVRTRGSHLALQWKIGFLVVILTLLGCVAWWYRRRKSRAQGAIRR